MTATKNLIEKLNVTVCSKEDNVFIGECEDIGFNRVFGGQVIAQALLSAQQTITLRQLHSLKCYFVRQGKLTMPISYHVACIRDGNSFAVRQVQAYQDGQIIMTMTCSFQLPQTGLQHQLDRPNFKALSQLITLHDCYQNLNKPLPKVLTRFINQDSPFEFKVEPNYNPLVTQASLSSRKIWFKVSTSSNAELSMQQALLAYLSDYGFLETALLPHALSIFSPKIKMASLDHSLHFHQDVDINQWHIFVCQSPCAQHGRAFVRGDIYNLKGDLIASVAQEGMIRYNHSI